MTGPALARKNGMKRSRFWLAVCRFVPRVVRNSSTRGATAMERSSRRLRRIGLVCLVLAVGTAAVALPLALYFHLGVAPAVTLTLGVPTLYLAWTTFRAARTESALPLAEVADQLAIAVRRQWEHEAGRRQLNDPYPLPVSWQAAEADLVEDWSHIVSTASGWPGANPSDWAAGPSDLAGSGGELAEVLVRVPTGRLVVLGEPGAGKTMLLVRLVLDLLNHRAGGDPVPVLVPLASWNPTEQDLRTWLSGRLAIDFPGLAEPAPSAAGNRTWGQALLAAGLLLPILDGLDEIPEAVRGQALAQINTALRPGDRLVVSARIEDYRQTVHPLGGVQVKLRGAVGVVLRDIDALSIKSYLRSSMRSPSPAADRLNEVLAHIDRNPHGPLAKVLRTPLTVNLLRLVYADDRTAPNELLDPVRFGDTAAIERHLFDAFIQAFYRPAFGLPGPRWSYNRTVIWLGFLARHLQQTGARDLAWWRLHYAAPGAVFQVIGLGVGLVGGLASGLAFALGVGLWVGLAFGLASALMIGLVLRHAAKSASPPFPARIRLWGNTGRLARWLGLGAGAGLVGALATLLGGGPWAAALGWLAVGVGAGLVGGLHEAVNVAADIGGAGSPLLVLRQDRVLALVRGAMTGLTAILVVGLSGGLARSLVAGVVFGGASALAGASSTAYYRYVVGHAWLAIRGRLPWALMSFLDDAHRRGMLRRVGGVYQFRHAQVQERLATHSTSEDVVRQPIDTAAVEAISALREWLVDTAFERADVRAVVEKPRIEALKQEIGAEIESTRIQIAGATTAARERFMAAKARYVGQVGVPALSGGARIYAFVATAMAGFACTGFFVSAIQFPGDVLMILSAGLVGVAALLMVVPRLVTIAQAFQARIAREEEEPDDEPQPERRPGPGKRLSSLIVALAGLKGKWLVASPVIASGGVATSLAFFAVGLLQVWDPNYLPSVNPTPIPAAALGGLVFASLWMWARPWRSRSLALRSEDPRHWPTNQEVKRAARACQDAEQARAEWVKALLENGVLPLVSAKIEVVSRRSYQTLLPEASVEKLGDITESAQFVPTETSAQLNRMLNAMSSGAIGLSGPRGIGKSTMLRMLGDRRFGASPDDLTLVVPAPTNYNSRDFLVHLFTRMCELVLPAEAGTSTTALATVPSGGRTRRRSPWLVMACLGGMLVLGATGWPIMVRAGAWLQDNVRTAAIAIGMVMIAFPLAMIGWSMIRAGRRGRRRATSPEDIARHRLRSLRYLETNTLTRTGALKAPTGVELGGSTSRQRAEQLKTYPELVNDFRDFLDYLGLRLRSRADRPGSRIIICIDELDKIATAEQAERFINDIKTVFGIEGCFFLVAVSEDALASFTRRTLAVRTTFDSAFDSVIQVRRFLLADTRRLLVQRVLRLPEPFVWLCHSLSGGLPRDLNRTVRLMYDIRSTHNTDRLDRLAAELIRQDIETVAHGQLLRVSGRVDPDSGSVLRWLAAAKHLPLDSDRLMRHCRDAPRMDVAQRTSGGSDYDELLLLTEQFRTYMYYVATLVRSFCEKNSSMIGQLESADDDSANPMQHLAEARVHLSVDPAMAWAAVDAYQACAVGAHLLTGEATQPPPTGSR